MSAAQADRAALLAADAKAPFVDAQAIVVRAPLGFGLWWWDGGRLREAGLPPAGGAGRVAPESALFVVEDGWSQVVTREGVEARYCRDLTLIASQWRRRPFTPEQWRAFADSVDGATSPAPGYPPEPIAPQTIARASALPIVTPPQLWSRLERLAWASSAICGAACLAFAAQAISFVVAENADRRAFEALQAEAANDPQTAINEADVALIRAHADLVGRPSPVLVAAEAYRSLGPFSIKPKRWEVDSEKLRIEIGGQGDAKIEDIASTLEKSRLLKNVFAQKDPITGEQIVIADICGALRDPACRDGDGDASGGGQ